MSLVAYNSSSDESEEEIKSVKKPKESVKIVIPSLKEFEDDDDDDKPAAKKQKFKSGSGLFSLLPPPKNAPSIEKSGLVPHILLSKKEKPLSSSIKSKKNDTSSSDPLKSTTSSTSEVTAPEEQESDDENISLKDNSDTPGICDFFWLDDLASKNETKVEDNPSIKKNTFIQNLSPELPCSSTVHQAYFNERKEDVYVQQHQQMPFVEVPEVKENTSCNLSDQQWQLEDENYVNNSNDGSEDSLLNDKEFLKLKGRRRELENVDIIDVKADDHLTNKNEWLKNLTEEMTYKPTKKHGLPTQQQKRKHQITYLAFQAKEREMDLKNQWSLNRRTRRETQSKYGF